MAKSHVRKGSLKKLSGYINSLSSIVQDVVSSRYFVISVFAWFIIQAVYIALSTKIGTPPDENYHYLFIQFFSDSGWLPFVSDQTGYYALGEAARTPFFIYHYLMSFPVHFLGSGETTFYLLRIFNILFGAGSLYLVYKIADKALVSKLVRNLSLFMLANTLMFVFLSASINYDNLFIFISLASVLLLITIFNKPSLLRVQLLAICLTIGLLTKVSFLPIAFVVLLVLTIKIARDKKEFIKSLRARSGGSIITRVSLWLILALVLSLFLQRYAVNLVTYQTFSPKCAQVLEVDKCRQNPVFARDERLDNMARPTATKDIVEYSGSWVLLMQERIYGIFAHKSFAPHKSISVSLSLIMLVGLIAFLRLYQTHEKFMNILLVIIVLYVVVLLLENFARYQKYGSFTFAVQGRYLFAVLPLIYIILNKYVLDFLQRKILKLTYLITALLIFAASSLPSYIVFTTSDWHTRKTAGINRSIKSIFVK